MMQKYPIGIQDFRELRTGGYVYIDKTKDIHTLIETGKYYFLSRPRRFGKSLLLSTLKYLFLGEKELFKGLWIEDKHDWEPCPVLHFSFSSIGYKDISLNEALLELLNNTAESFGITLNRPGIALKFRELLEKLSEREGQVVLLVDEYDKPLVDYLDDPAQAEENRDVIKNFFSIIKDSGSLLRFVLITGVSKFSKVSLFSDLNNLDDITLAPDFSTITGYTQEELDHYFQEEIISLGIAEEITLQETRHKIRSWYNGYNWEIGDLVYNPFSILRLFRHRKFANYWWETGTPTFLLKQLRKGFHYKLDKLEAGSDLFESFTLETLDWKSLLFQTGYLTIHHFDRANRLYTLGYPNLEVKDAMYRHLLALYREANQSESQSVMISIKKSLEKGDMERLILLINTLFSTIPHQLFLQKQEAFFHAVLHLCFSGIGLLVQSEVSTSKGRVDTVVHTTDRVYVIEFKLDSSAASALEQIRNRRYGSPYLGQEKEVIALGINFGSAEKEVTEWEALPYESLLIEG